MLTRKQKDRRNARHRERMATDPDYAERYRARKREWAQRHAERKPAGSACADALRPA